MYIVWRRRPVTSDRRTELFVEYWDDRVTNAEGKTVKQGRHKSASGVAPWKPLWCNHRGPGRIAWTPLLMHAERVNGKPRQKLLRRLPTIRSCCIQDRFLRAAWWHDINQWIKSAEEIIGWNGLEGEFMARDKQKILTKLREVVPPPTAAGIRDFTAYRLEKEAEDKRRDEAIAAEARRRAEEDNRRREEQRRSQEEQARQKKEARDKMQREWSRQWGTFMGGRAGSVAASPGEAWWSVLGVSPTATLAEVKARYRELAKQHHPDRFGDEKTFKKVSAAYEIARKILEKRA